MVIIALLVVNWRRITFAHAVAAADFTRVHCSRKREINNYCWFNEHSEEATPESVITRLTGHD
jgi:hypothetical protein